ncbi:MAG: hypothetical protein ACLFV2_08165 [Desulfurivibrionaceae bacterium]
MLYTYYIGHSTVYFNPAASCHLVPDFIQDMNSIKKQDDNEVKRLL